MATIDRTHYFNSEAEARKFAEQFEAQYSGAWNPYEGAAVVVPPNEDRQAWAVYTSRRDSAD